MTTNGLSISAQVDLRLDHLDPIYFTRADFVAAALARCKDTAAKALYVKRRAGIKWDETYGAGTQVIAGDNDVL